MALPERCQQDLERLVRDGNRNLGLNLVVDSAKTDHTGRCTITLKPHGVKCLDDRLKPLQPHQPTPKPIKDEINRFAGAMSQLQFNSFAKDIEFKTRQPVHVKEVARSPGSAPKINVQPLSKPFLKGGVGRAANAREDVALVQAALSNIKSPDGQPYWRSHISGVPGMTLIEAINAFEISIGQKRSGKILPGSPAEAVMVNMLPREMKHLRCVPGTEAVYCTTEVPIDIERLVRQTEQSQSIHPMNRSAVAALQRGVFKDTGLCLVSRNVNLAGNNNVAPVTFECADTIWLGQDGRPSLHPSQAIPNQQVLDRVTNIASQNGLSISSGPNGLEATNPAAEKFTDEMSLIAQGTGAGIANSMLQDAKIRKAYSLSVENMSKHYMAAVQADRLDAVRAAQSAQQFRNRMLNNARQNGSAHAKAIAENLKSKGLSFEQLVDKTAGTSDISDLPEEQRAKVATEIILSSGRTRPSVNTTTIAMDLGGKFIWAIEYALAFWAVIEADEKSRIAAREATTLAGGAIGAQIATTFAAAALAGAGLALTGLPAIILGIAVIILGGYLGAKLSQGVYDSIVEGKLWR